MRLAQICIPPVHHTQRKGKRAKIGELSGEVGKVMQAEFWL
jgi:hypothetical protein